MKAAAWIVVYAAAIVAANWSIVTFGVVPVGFGLMAPAGVYCAGLVFGIRDGLREAGGFRLAMLAVALGVALSWALEVRLSGDLVARIAIASGVAFGLSETLDALVYERLRARRAVALAASNAVGLVLDSAVFLAIAFGSLAFMPGQVAAKAYMTVLALAVLALWRLRNWPVHKLP